MESSSREKILEVAEARFAERGFAGVGMRELAAEVGLGKSSLFHHFPSKAALYVAVLARVVDRIEAHVLPAAALSQSPAVQLDAAVDALIDAVAEHPTTARLLLRSLVEDDGIDPDLPGVRETEARIQGLVQTFVALLAADSHGVAAPAHTVQVLIGAVVFHFASGEFGDAVVGRPVFSAEAVGAHRRAVKHLLRSGLVSEHPLRAPKENPPS